MIAVIASCAVWLNEVLSVLIYEIKPCSYSLCATLIVRDTPNPSFLLASCCNVDVINGAEGFLFSGFLTMSLIL